ncbi:MAG TPA: HAD family hydrolase [Terriglobia bacterium]|jgi:3-deoxy-D-manno-octulosonate 8-phosphate phosphatase (KDO 8-P phosphatase)|nr:HAD family hydrolase [Terriglobia bacterium]
MNPKKPTRHAIQARARRIRLLLLDVDGVLTDGRIYYVPAPARAAESADAGLKLVETKTFHSRDGLGINIWHRNGFKTGIISGRDSPIVDYRARELGIQFVRQGHREKLGPYREILQEAGLQDREVCYVGDDLVDLPLLTRVGLSVAVGDSHPLLARYVHYVTRAHGGLGAVREVIELILTAQGKFKPVLDGYLARG